jgi:hypothetical protein
MVLRRGAGHATNQLKRCKTFHGTKHRDYHSSAFEKVATTGLDPSVSVDFSFWSKIFDDKHPVLFKGRFDYILNALFIITILHYKAILILIEDVLILIYRIGQ